MLGYDSCSFLLAATWIRNTNNIEEARHINELAESPNLVITIDKYQMGVGGYDSWSSRSHPLKEHQILPGNHVMQFVIKPRKGDD
ncbi:MAG: hypothetical protein EU530_03670 [Promethearchaeota archaeon]|nr:MAG: hypothetical protein EU530_03670 [Candidatus Lokiarchaeota archaeon]